jgi:beta-phosphoglucomutase-like phosphatase (HAD superfamily)
MVVEDSPNGILAARRADMFTVAVRNRYNFNLDLGRADRIFSGLDHFDWTLFEER